MRPLVFVRVAVAATLFIWLAALASAADVEKGPWTVTVYSKGGTGPRSIALAADDPLNADIEELLAKCDKRGRLDLNTYAPSVRVERGDDVILLNSTRVIHTGKSRKSDADDKTLRNALIAAAGKRQ